MAITDLINCECADSTGYRTLAQLRTDVLAACGFIDPFARAGTRTRAQLRQAMREALGLADPLTSAETRTLVVLRAEVHRMLGFAAFGANYAPGMSALIDDWINEAQQTLWRRIELDNGGIALPARMVADANLTTLDATPILMLAVAWGKAHYAMPDAKAYFDQTEKFLADWAARSPPGLDDMLNAALSQAHDTVQRRVEGMGESAASTVSGTFDDDADVATVDDHGLLLLALGMMKAKVGQGDAKAQLDLYARYMEDLEKRMPPNARMLATSYLKSAHRQIYYRYDALRTERWFSWPLTADVALYDLPDNAEVCTKQLNPMKVRWVGVQDYDGGWRELVAGIPPRVHGHDQTGRPERYEIRQCIEVWPAPEATEGTLVIKGHYLPEAFTADGDVPTVDDELVFLMAVANTKGHFKHPDAQSYIAQMETHLRKLVAGTHTTKRYVPGERNDRLGWVEPKYIGPDAW